MLTIAGLQVYIIITTKNENFYQNLVRPLAMITALKIVQVIP